jgi:hypothetical protein
VYGDPNRGGLCKSYRHFLAYVLDEEDSVWEQKKDPTYDVNHIDLTRVISETLCYTCPSKDAMTVDQGTPLSELFDFLPQDVQLPAIHFGYCSQDRNDCQEFANWLPIIDRVEPNRSYVGICLNKDDPDYGKFGMLTDLEENTGTWILPGANLDFIKECPELPAADKDSKMEYTREYFNRVSNTLFNWTNM